MEDIRMTTPPEWAALIDSYIRSLAAAGQSPATQVSRRDQLRQMARAVGCPPDELTEQILTDWMGSQCWRHETRRSVRAGVRGFCAWAHHNGHISGDPAINLPAVACEVGPPRPAPDEALWQGLACADERTRLMLRLAAELGLRRGEISRVHSSDVVDGVDGPHLVVHGKGSKVRVIPIPAGLARRIGSAQGWVFPSRKGGHLGARRVGELCSQVLPRPWTVHALRHRFASRAYAGTHDVRSVQLLLGHESLATTQRYIGVDEHALRAAMLAAA